MNPKQKLAFTLITIICILFGLLSAEFLWWVLLPVWALVIYHTRKLYSQESIKLQVLDLCLLIIGLSEIILYFCSTYIANSIQYPLICLSFI